MPPGAGVAYAAEVTGDGMRMKLLSDPRVLRLRPMPLTRLLSLLLGLCVQEVQKVFPERCVRV